MQTTFDWEPNDPRSKSPVPGEPGHFDNHEWLIEFAKKAYAELAALNARIDELEQPKRTTRKAAQG